jgi:D-glycero-alpha-D-manno-heptose-7-phosphate kinase
LMLFFTGISRFASDIAKSQIENTPNKKKELNSMYQMVDEAIGILTQKKDILDFGKLLNESWQLKRSLSDKISSPEIDNIYQVAMASGALGGKLLGAGGGGFLLLFVAPENQPKVREALKNLLEVKFNFETGGSQIIYYNPQ